MSNPLISIITVNFNNSQGLARTLSSVTSQEFSRLEQIVVDGGSTDGSIDIIQDSRYRVDRYVSEMDRGIYHAMNKGIEMATGEYLLFLNSGDHFRSATALSAAEPLLGSADLLYSSLEICSASVAGAHSSLRQYPNILNFSFFAETSLPHPSTLIRAELFDRFGLYDESLKICADWKHFMLWVCRYNCTYAQIPDAMSVFYEDGISSSKSSQELILKERTSTMQMEFPAFVNDFGELLSTRRDSLMLKKLRVSGRIRVLKRLGILVDF